MHSVLDLAVVDLSRKVQDPWLSEANRTRIQSTRRAYLTTLQLSLTGTHIKWYGSPTANHPNITHQQCHDASLSTAACRVQTLSVYINTFASSPCHRYFAKNIVRPSAKLKLVGFVWSFSSPRPPEGPLSPLAHYGPRVHCYRRLKVFVVVVVLFFVLNFFRFLVRCSVAVALVACGGCN